MNSVIFFNEQVSLAAMAEAQEIAFLSFLVMRVMRRKQNSTVVVQESCDIR